MNISNNLSKNESIPIIINYVNNYKNTKIHHILFFSRLRKISKTVKFAVY